MTPQHDYVSPIEGDEVRVERRLDQVALLGALHAAGKLHRDVKPSNVVPDAVGQPIRDPLLQHAS